MHTAFYVTLSKPCLFAGFRLSEGKLAIKFLGTSIRSLYLVRVFLADFGWQMNGSQQRRRQEKVLDDMAERKKKQLNERKHCVVSESLL